MRKRQLALWMALAMLISCVGLLAGCKDNEDGDEAGLVGSWTATVDLSEADGASLKAAMGDEAEYFDTGKMKVLVVWDISLNANGSYTMSKREKDPGTAYQTILEMYAEASLAAQGFSKKDIIALYGTWDNVLDDVATTINFDMDHIIDPREKSGYYQVDGQRIYLLEKKDDSTDGADWMEFEMAEDKLVVTELSGDFNDAWAEAIGMGFSPYPVSFERA